MFPHKLYLLIIAACILATTFVTALSCNSTFETEIPHAYTYNVKSYSISDDHLAVWDIANMSPPQDWTPNLSVGLDAALPFAWPERYIEEWNQPFNPWAFCRNAAALCSYYRATGNETALSIMDDLYDRFMEYTIEDDGQLYVLYTFPYRYRKIDVEAPWTSAYASGAALIGLTLMYDVTGRTEVLETARMVVAGLASPIDPRRERPRYWVSFVDEREFLWFEEMPLDQVEQPRILNGHIRAITGLFYYWAFTGDEEALQLLRGGITTMEEYVPYYRRPGEINAYDQLEPYRADYGPLRTIDQQLILYRMTGEPIFRHYAELFEQDHEGQV